MKAIQRQGGDAAGVIGEDTRETLRDTHSGKMDNTRPTSNSVYLQHIYISNHPEIPNPIQLNPNRTHLTKTKLR